MNTVLIDVAVGAVLFILGTVLTVRKFVQHDRAVFIAVALLSPLLACVSVLRLLYLLTRGQVTVDPCPAGLEEAEIEVARHRQALFGGELRKPTFAASWAQAYQRELQRELERVQNLAERYLVVA